MFHGLFHALFHEMNKEAGVLLVDTDSTSFRFPMYRFYTWLHVQNLHMSCTDFIHVMYRIYTWSCTEFTH
jgi:hypothetical protein